jgi:chromate transport protein ChrA
MDQRQVGTPAFMIALTCFTAPLAAAMLGYIAHYDFGLSRQEIRTPAVVGAAVIAVVIVTLAALDFFRKRPRKRRLREAMEACTVLG